MNRKLTEEEFQALGVDRVEVNRILASPHIVSCYRGSSIAYYGPFNNYNEAIRWTEKRMGEFAILPLRDPHKEPPRSIAGEVLLGE